MSRERAVVLLSGGLDSAYNLWRASRDYDVVLALTFDYGQRAARKEIWSAATLAGKRKVPHQVIHLPFFKDFTNSSLVNRDAAIPVADQVQIDSMERSTDTAKAVWVPNRNGIFINIAAAYAEGLGASTILAGFNLEEAATFPDNSQAFLDAVTESLNFSTSNHVKVFSYCATMNKPQIVESGRNLELPLSDLWPCYFEGEEWCGVCESCQRFARAVRENSSQVENENTLD